MARQQLKTPAAQATDRLLELRGLLHGLTVLTKDLGATTDVAEAVGVGRELWRIIELAHKRINVVKDRLRAEVGLNPGKHRIAGPDFAECLIQVPEPTPVLRKGITPPDLRETLGMDIVDLLFVRNVSWKPHKEFQARLAGLSPETVKAALGTVDLPTSKPRVTFIRRNP